MRPTGSALVSERPITNLPLGCLTACWAKPAPADVPSPSFCSTFHGALSLPPFAVPHASRFVLKGALMLVAWKLLRRALLETSISWGRSRTAWRPSPAPFAIFAKPRWNRTASLSRGEHQGPTYHRGCRLRRVRVTSSAPGRAQVPCRSTSASVMSCCRSSRPRLPHHARLPGPRLAGYSGEQHR